MARPVRALLFATALALFTIGEASAQKTIFVTRDDWHSGIVISRRDVPNGVLPELADFPDAAYFEFGWGHSKYYPIQHKTIAMMLDGIVPSTAVIHLIGLARHPSEVFPDHELITLEVSSGGFSRLILYLDKSFKRSGRRRVKASSPGHYSFSAFYPATGIFHLLNTCNTWTARGLAAAGFHIRVSGLLQASGLMGQLRTLEHMEPVLVH